MATRYWVGGTGTWDASSTTHWAASSGGASGASAPTSSDDVIIDGSSGSTFTITCSSGLAICNTLTAGFAFSLTLTGTLQVNNGITINSTLSSPTISVNFLLGTPSLTATFNSFFPLSGNVNLGSSTTIFNWTLGSALNTTGNLIFNSGGFVNPSNFAITANAVTYGAIGTTSISLGSCTITVTGNSWNFGTTTGLTFSGASANIVYSNAVSPGPFTFAGGGLTYGNLSFTGSSPGSVTYAITGSNTFNTIIASKTFSYTIQLPAGGTTTVSNWTASGLSGVNTLTLTTSSSPTTTNLVKTGGGNISGVDYVAASYISATPSTNTWYVGANSLNVTGNTGLIFTAAPAGSSSSNFFMLF